MELFGFVAGLWLVYKAIALVVSLVAVLGIVIFTLKNQRFHESRDIRGAMRVRSSAPGLITAVSSHPIAQDDWRRIMNRLEGEDPKNYLRAILEADGLCDYALKAKGFPGETMGERMQAIRTDQIASLEDFWRAHKVRNELAHDPNRPISPSEGDVMMRIYERVLTELEAI